MKGVLLLLSLIATLGASATAETISFHDRLGLQLYSLRAEFNEKGVDATLDMVRDMGVKLVELAGTYGLSAAEYKAKLDARDLTAVAAHFSYNTWRDDPESIVPEAEALGVRYVGCAYVPHKAPLDEAQTRDIIKVFNRAGEVMAAKGLIYYYHFHGFEFQPFGDDSTLADLIVTETNADKVKFQMDTVWIHYPGHDCVTWLGKYPDRWVSMHLKDLKKGVAVGFITGKTDVENNVTLGTGQLEWLPILRKAEQIGVVHYFLEDESSSSVKQLPASLEYLATIKTTAN